MQRRHQFLIARAAYVGVVLLATLSQLDFSPDLNAAALRLARAFTLSLEWRDAIDGLRNLALFAGLGAVWVVTSISGKVRQEVWRSALWGCAISVTVEGLQVFSPIRTASIIDVTTNTLGTLGGSVVVAMLITEVVRRRGTRSYLGLPTFLAAASYLLAVVCESVTPLFRSEPVKGIYGGPWIRLRAMLALATPLSLDQIPLSDIPLYAAAGFLAVMWLAEVGRDATRGWRGVAIVGAAGAFALELAHGGLGVTIRWEGAATDAFSLVFGAWAAARWLPAATRTFRGAERARAATYAYAALLMLWAWRPLYPRVDGDEILAQLSIPHLVPLESLAVRADVFSALHVAQQFLLYLPLGALLAVWPLRKKGWWGNLTPALILAAILEMGHLLIEDRFFDVTNFLIAAAGLAIGWVVLRRSGYPVYGESQAG